MWRCPNGWPRRLACAALDRAGVQAKHGGMNQTLVFEPRETPPPLGDDDIHLWFFSSAVPTPARAVAQAARAMLERLLCAYAGSAQAPRIERGAHGKPYAPERPELEFNLSHTGAHVLIGFARAQALGVDLECRDRRLSLDDIAQRFFAPAEARALQRLDGTAKRAAFLRLWTHKEAVLKALGAGLSFGLDRVEFALGADARVSGLHRLAAEAGAIADWRLHALEPLPGVSGALAWRGPPRVVRAFAAPP